MILHKILFSAEAGLHLPNAQSRLRELNRVFGDKGSFSEKWIVNGFEIRVSQDGEIQHIWIRNIGDAFYFEFATSAFPVKQIDLEQDGIDFKGYQGAIVGVQVRAAGAGLTTIPVIRGSRRSDTGADVSAIGRPWQAQLINEPVSYPYQVTKNSVTTYPEALYESFAPGNAHTGVLLRSSELVRGYPDRAGPGPITQHVTRDIGFDVPYRHGQRAGHVVDSCLQGRADWPRAMGYQKVTDPDIGSRTFAIYVDAFNQFFVFPVAAIGTATPSRQTDQNVEAQFIKMVTPVFPSWCYVPTTKARDYYAVDKNPEHTLVDRPELDWKFNHTGTKAASIVYARSPFEFDDGYWSSNVGGGDMEPVFPFTNDLFNEVARSMGVQSRFDQAPPEGQYKPARYLTAPGIVEVSIRINLEGPELFEFTPTITLRVVRDPTAAGDKLVRHCALITGYCWYDIAGVRTDPLIDPPKLASAGDFVAFDIERWSPKTGDLGTWSFVSPGNLAHILSIKNLDTGTEIASYDANELVAVDLPTLSFVMLTYPAASLPSSGLHTFGAAVYINTKLTEVLYTKEAPTELQKTQMTAQASIVGRDEINALIANDPRWQLVPLNPALDGFDDPRMLMYRECFARGATFFCFKAASTGLSANGFYKGTATSLSPIDPLSDVYKRSDPPFDFDANAALLRDVLEDVDGRWAGYPQIVGSEHPFFCKAPRWGWNCYASIIARFMWLAPETTFFVHPGGSWAFWSNLFVNNRNPYNNPTNPRFFQFDAAKLEHIIFDRVHLTMTVRGTQSSADTTFVELYNRATQTGLDSDALDSGDFEIMEPESLRASFIAQGLFFNAGDRYIELLDLRANWDEQSWYMPDGNVWGLIIPPELGIGPRPYGGSTVAPTFGQPWYNGGNYSADRSGASIPVQSPHVRFANPVIVGI